MWNQAGRAQQRDFGADKSSVSQNPKVAIKKA
jgi:hypothetical protein